MAQQQSLDTKQHQAVNDNISGPLASPFSYAKFGSGSPAIGAAHV